MMTAGHREEPPRLRRKRLGEILCFVLPAAIFLTWNLLNHSVAELGADARLYLSVADNFLSTGHFIQTARPYTNFVVPFGLPLVLTVLRSLHLGVEAITLLQHLLPGLSCFFLLKAERSLFGRGGFAPCFLMIALLRLGINPNNIYVEYYYLPILCWLVFTSLRTDLEEKRKITRLNMGGFLAFVFRPVLGVVYVVILGYTLYRLCRRGLSPTRFALLLVIPLLIMGANTLLNHRETGYWIPVSSYSGRDMYMANNPCANPRFYTGLDSTVGEEYYEVMERYDPDTKLQSDALKALSAQWARENPGTFLRNTATRFREDFVWIWRYALVVCFLSWGAFLWFAPERRPWLLVTMGANLALAVITAMGIAEPRYTLPVWVLAALHLSLPAHEVFYRLARVKNRETVHN